MSIYVYVSYLINISKYIYISNFNIFHSCRLQFYSCRNTVIPVESSLIPVDSNPIPADSCPIPVDSSGILTVLQECEGHQEVLVRGCIIFLFFQKKKN